MKNNVQNNEYFVDQEAPGEKKRRGKDSNNPMFERYSLSRGRVNITQFISDFDDVYAVPNHEIKITTTIDAIK